MTSTLSDIFKEFNGIEWRTYETFSALKAFGGFWRETERLVTSAADEEERLHSPGWKPVTDQEISEYMAEVQAVRHLHDGVIKPTLRYSVVVTLFATFERELRRAADNVARETKETISYKGLKGSLVAFVAKYIQVHRGFSLSELPGYTQIHDLQKVRDCIVHCYGDVELSRDRDYLLKLSAAAKGLDAYDGTEMEIAPLFIEESIRAQWVFFGALFRKLGWKIDDKWLAGRNHELQAPNKPGADALR